MLGVSFTTRFRKVRHLRPPALAAHAALGATPMRRAAVQRSSAPWLAESLEGRLLLSAIVPATALTAPPGANAFTQAYALPNTVTPATGGATTFDVKLSLANTVIVEGDTASLTGSFTDPGAATGAHSLQIDWGDGSTDMLTLPAGASTFAHTHRFLDNRPNDAPYLIDAVVTSSDTFGFGQIDEQVVNQLPSHVRIQLSKQTLTSGQSESLTGTFRDHGTLDSHQVIIYWGDQQNTTLDLGPGVLTFQASHVYTNGKKAPVNSAIEVSVLDSDSLPTFTGPVTVDNFQFTQLNWVNPKGVPFANNSSWGVLNVDVNADPAQQSFLNVVADAGHGTAWIVQNLPLDANYNHQSVDFDITQLGIPAGTNLASLQYTFSIDQTIRGTAPNGTMTGATVGDQTERSANLPGKTSGPPPQPGVPNGVKINGTIDENASTAARPDVPGVQEGSLQCMPGAFARSLAWLNVAHALGLTKKVKGKDVPPTAQDIYTALAKLLGRNSDGDRIALKADVLASEAKKAGNTGQTKLFDPGKSVTLPANDKNVTRDKSEKDLIKWMKREMNNGEDVEMAYQVQGEIWHIITITRIIQTDKGVYVEYRDDEAQGNDKKGDAGVKTAELASDGNGGYTFRRTEPGKPGKDKPILFQVKYAVSESVIAAQVTVKPKGK